MRLSISLKVSIWSGWLVLTVADVQEGGLGFGGGVGRTLRGTPLKTEGGLCGRLFLFTVVVLKLLGQ